MLRLVKDVFNSVTNVTFAATHTVKYRYESGQGGSYTGAGNFTALTIKDVPEQFKRVQQLVASAEAGVGPIYARNTLIEIKGQINGRQIACEVNSVEDLAAKLQAFGVEVERCQNDARHVTRP